MARIHLLTSIFLLGSLRCVASGDTVFVEPERYAVDLALGLVLVTEDVAVLNAQSPHLKRVIRVDSHIILDEAVAALEVGVAYAATNEEGQPLTVYCTDLPVIWMDTPFTIVDEPKVHAQFRMHAAGMTDVVHDIGIETRGGFTQSLPKKSYRIEFWADAAGSASSDIALLGMRSDDDWNLLAQYNEPLRIGSDLGQALWMDMHTPYYSALEPQAMSGVQMKHVEVILNGRYQGVYALSEPMDRKQLRLKQFNGTLRGQLCKGANWGSGVNMSAAPPFDNGSLQWAGFDYEYPEELIEWNGLHAFVDFVVHADPQTLRQEFPLRFDMDNAVDYFLLLNLLRAPDNTAKNIYVARYDATEPYFYVPWDLDGVLGVQWNGLIDTAVTGILINGLYARLTGDCWPDGFVHRVRTRWNELRGDVFATAQLIERYAVEHDRLLGAGAYTREEMAWNDYTYDPEEPQRVAQWIEERTAFLDAWFLSTCSGTGVSSLDAVNEVHVYPNPARDHVVIEGDALRPGMAIEVMDAIGRIVHRIPVRAQRSVVDLEGLAAGPYRVNLILNGRVLGGRALVVE